MTEQDPIQPTPAPADQHPELLEERRPFVRPAVVDLGGLEQITLIGGSL